MTLPELDRALRQLRLSGMADVLEARLRQAQTERQAPLDLVAALVTDELVRRQDRLLARLPSARTIGRFTSGRTIRLLEAGRPRPLPSRLGFDHLA